MVEDERPAASRPPGAQRADDGYSRAWDVVLWVILAVLLLALFCTGVIPLTL